MAITPYILSPQSAASPHYHSCPLPPWGEKGQGHEDKHRKVKVGARGREGGRERKI